MSIHTTRAGRRLELTGKTKRDSTGRDMLEVFAVNDPAWLELWSPEMWAKETTEEQPRREG